jgi:hypothetical protein
MKRLFIYALCASVFFVGLGAMVEGVGARFKSDAKALDVIAKARQAVGGDAALAGVRSMVITGQSTHTFIIDGQTRTEQGQTEIALQMPNQLSKRIKIGSGDGSESAMRSHDVMILKRGDGEIIEGKDGEFTTPDGKKIIIKKSDGGNAEFNSADGKKFTITVDGGTAGENVKEIETPDGKKRVIVRTIDGGNAATWSDEKGENVTVDGKNIQIRRAAHGADGMRNNELLRLTLSLLLTSPEGMDVSYSFVGEGTVDGTAVNTVDAAFAGSTVRMHFDRTSYLPVAISYTGHKMPIMIHRTTNGEGVTGDKQIAVFAKKMEGPGEGSEHFVRFTDYRSVGGVQLPHRWTTTVGGQLSESFEVSTFEINPANIAERFSEQKVFVRTKQPGQ